MEFGSDRFGNLDSSYLVSVSIIGGLSLDSRREGELFSAREKHSTKNAINKKCDKQKTADFWMYVLNLLWS